MKRCSSRFLAQVILGLFLSALPLPAAEYEAAAPPLAVPAPAATTNDLSARAVELELRAQYRLLSALAQEHRQRSEAAAKDQLLPKAGWETALAEELDQRGSNVLSQLAQIAPREGALAGGDSLESMKDLNAVERAYLVKLQERLQAVHQELAGASAEITYYALQSATNNNNTTSYVDTPGSQRLRDVASEVKQLQSEQARLELARLEFFALRSVLQRSQNAARP